jgi:peptide/nickel transport system permease protein
MVLFAIRRIGAGIPLIIGIVVFLFVLLELAPGDPVQAIVGDFPVPDEYRAQLVAEYNLDAPLLERFSTYATTLLRGDLGESFYNERSVSELIRARLPNTLLLISLGMAASFVIGTALGLLSASTKQSGVDSGVSAFSLFGYSIPNFWLAQILVVVFALRLGWLPSQGMRDLRSDATGLAALSSRASYLVLPVIALSLRELAAVSRIARSSARLTLAQDHIETAYAKGLTKRQVVTGHVLRNSLVPVVTVTGYRFGSAIAGTVVIETVFSWPGIGQLFVESVGRRDNQIVVGIFIVVTVLVVVVNVLTDLLYGLLDPRIRMS